MNVFSASYYSFLPGSLPAVLAARALGMPAVMNDWCGEACERYEWTKVCAQWLVLYRESVHAPAVTATTAA